MIRDCIQQMKSYSLFEHLKFGYYVDALDQKKWKVGMVKSIHKYALRTTVQIKFDGCYTRDNIYVDLSCSQRLAPFRKFSLPFTGYPYSEPKRDDPLNTLQFYIDELNQINSIDQWKSEKINQFMRGELFIYVDYLLTKKKNQTPYSVVQICKFCSKYIKIISNLLKTCLDCLAQLQKQNIFEPNLIYVHPKVSIIFCIIEQLFNLNTITNRNQKRLTLDVSYGQEGHVEVKKLRQQILNSEILGYCDKLMSFRGFNNRSLPWSIKKEIIILQHNLKDTPFPTLSQSYEIIDILDYSEYLRLKGVISKEQKQIITLQLVLHLISKGNFEGRLKGLNEFKKLNDDRYMYLKKQKVMKQLENHGILNLLIDNSTFNSEIFKRSIVIFQFYHQKNALTNKHLNRIISLHKDKHQLELRSFYSSLTEFGRFLSQQLLTDFFKLIETLPMEQNLMSLIKDYSIMIVQNSPYYRNQYYVKNQHNFGTQLFWSYINSDKNINQVLMNKIIQSFTTLLSNTAFSKHVDEYIIKCIKGIEQGKHFQRYLKVIHQGAKNIKYSRMERAIELVEKQVNIIQALMKYVKKHNKKISQSIYENMFEFLQAVNHITRNRLNFSQIRQLWEYNDCRNYLLKFLRKYGYKSSENKSHQRIIYKQLSISLIHQLLTKLFLDSKIMNYRECNAEIYQTVDQLIVCYNNHYDYITYNYKHTIRVRKVQKLYAMDFYINIVNASPDQVLVEKALRRFIEMYLRPIVNYHTSRNQQINNRFHNWKIILRIISNLEQNKLLGYKLFLQQLEGRMKSLNILEPEPVTIPVLMKQTSQLKKITIPRYTSLWKFRDIIGKQFEIQNTNFDIYCSGGKNTFDKEEDFSVAYIVVSKIYSSNVTIYSSNEIHPYYEAKIRFHEFMSEQIGQELYHMLEDKDNAKQVIQILGQIPNLRILKDKIFKLHFKNWNEILDAKYIWKLSYQLKVIQSAKNPKWAYAFLDKKGGINYLLDLLHEHSSSNQYNILKQVLVLLIQMIKWSKDKILPFKPQFLNQIIRVPKKINPSFTKYLSTMFSLIQQLRKLKVNVAYILNHKDIHEILKIILFTNSNMKSKIPEILYQIFSKEVENLRHFCQIIKKFMNQENLIENQYSCAQFFKFINLLIQNELSHLISAQLKNVLRWVKKNKNIEQVDDKCNELLYGFLQCCYNLLKANNLSQMIGQQPKNFIFDLVNCYLFNPQKPSKTILKSNECRSKAWCFLQMQTDNQIIVNEINNIIKPIMQKGAWRKQDYWQTKPINIVKKKFRGLKNLSATCYINSLVQQLYFVDSFSTQLLSIDAQNIRDKENIVIELQKIFGFLRYSQSSFYKPLSFCKTFILDGQPLNPQIQMDVDQFYHTLMDKIQRNLKEINCKEIITNIFQGQLSNLIIGQQCQHTSQRVQNFLSINLDIKQKKSLEQALDEFIKGQILQGDNAYSCERCDKKVKVMKRLCLKSLPPIITITLKRFQFDFETMEKLKLNTFCSFPEKINFLPYTRQGLQQECDPNNTADYQYVLKGVIIHYGFSQAGHYTSYIRTDNKNWYYFDDDKFFQFDSKDLNQQCFGGIEQNPYGDDEEKKKNAYLLFYEKIKSSHHNYKRSEVCEKIKNIVDEQNMKNKYINTLFEPGIQQYLFKISKHNRYLYLLYFHTVILRSKRKDQIVKHFKQCQNLLKNINLAKWYLNQINQAFVMQFIKFGDSNCKYIVISLIITCMNSNNDSIFLAELIKLISKTMSPQFFRIFPALNQSRFPSFKKHFKQIKFQEMMMKQITNDSKDQNQAKPKFSNNSSQFGNPTGNFSDNLKYDQIDMFQAISNFQISITLKQIRLYGEKINKIQTQISFAKIVTKKYKQMQKFDRIAEDYISSMLSSYDPPTGKQHIYRFVIILFNNLIEIEDKYSEDRSKKLIPHYFNALRDSLDGYKVTRILLQNMFILANRSVRFRQNMSNYLNENKKLLKNIKDWIRISDRFKALIENRKWAYWRKQARWTSMSDVLEGQANIQSELYEKNLNAIIGGKGIIKDYHTIQVGQEIEIECKTGKTGRMICKVLNKIGFLLEVQQPDKSVSFVVEEIAALPII